MNRLKVLSSSTIRHSRNIGLLLLISANSGCFAPSREPNTAARKISELPPHHQREPSRAGSKFNQRGGDERLVNPATQSQVRLNELLDYADKNSPVLLIARSSRSRAEAVKAASKSLFATNPELTLGLGPRFAPEGTGLDLELSFMQQIRVAGERGLREAAADRFAELTEEEIEEARWLIHCNIHATFHQALVEAKQVELSEQTVEFQTKVLRLVKRQIEIGELEAFNLPLASVELTQSKQELISAKQALQSTRLRLAQLSGWPASIPLLPEGNIDTPRPPPSIPSLVRAARDHLPNIRINRARLRFAEAQMSAAKREGAPRPEIGVQYTREGATGGNAATHGLLGVVALPIPVFQTNQAEQASARAEASLAQAELQASERSIEVKVAELHGRVSAAVERCEAYEAEIVPQIEQNLNSLRRAFEIGEIDLITLFASQDRFLKVQRDHLGAQRDYYNALAELEQAVGVELLDNDNRQENH